MILENERVFLDNLFEFDNSRIYKVGKFCYYEGTTSSLEYSFFKNVFKQKYLFDKIFLMDGKMVVRIKKALERML